VPEGTLAAHGRGEEQHAELPEQQGQDLLRHLTVGEELFQPRDRALGVLPHHGLGEREHVALDGTGDE